MTARAACTEADRRVFSSDRWTRLLIGGTAGLLLIGLALAAGLSSAAPANGLPAGDRPPASGTTSPAPASTGAADEPDTCILKTETNIWLARTLEAVRNSAREDAAADARRREAVALRRAAVDGRTVNDPVVPRSTREVPAAVDRRALAGYADLNRKVDKSVDSQLTAILPDADDLSRSLDTVIRIPTYGAEPSVLRRKAKPYMASPDHERPVPDMPSPEIAGVASIAEPAMPNDRPSPVQTAVETELASPRDVIRLTVAETHLPAPGTAAELAMRDVSRPRLATPAAKQVAAPREVVRLTVAETPASECLDASLPAAANRSGPAKNTEMTIGAISDATPQPIRPVPMRLQVEAGPADRDARAADGARVEFGAERSAAVLPVDRRGPDRAPRMTVVAQQPPATSAPATGSSLAIVPGSEPLPEPRRLPPRITLDIR